MNNVHFGLYILQKKEAYSLVKTKTLLFFAGLVWSIAGYNVTFIGISSYGRFLSISNFVLSTIIFLLFWGGIFCKTVNKQVLRISQLPNPKYYFWQFLDLKSFIMMAFMMTLGICIRTFSLMPMVFIAVFYTGLGLALFLAGIQYYIFYCKSIFISK